MLCIIHCSSEGDAVLQHSCLTACVLHMCFILSAVDQCSVTQCINTVILHMEPEEQLAFSRSYVV